jgi:hypothetical protein
MHNKLSVDNIRRLLCLQVVLGESQLESVRGTFSLFSKLQVETRALTRVDELVQ